MGRALRETIRARPVLLLPDALLLGLLVVLSAAPYLRTLGFYADDWAFLGILRTSEDQSLLGLADRLYDAQPLQRARPTQIGYEAALYRLFGLDPSGYQLVNLGVLVAMAALLYWALREAGVRRSLSLGIAAVYAVLPSYSTDRFWFAAFGYSLSMAFCFLSAYADLRALRERGARVVAWKAVAIAALVVAGLGYEVVLPLLVLSIAVVWLRAARIHDGGLVGRFGAAGAAAFIVPNVVALVAVAAYKTATAVGAGIPTDDLAFYLGQLVFGSLALHFGSYGIALPATTWWGLDHVGWLELAAAVAAGLLVFVHVAAAARSERPLAIRGAAALGAVGIALFALGYAVFLTTDRIQFGSSTGIVNRTAIAAALGAAFVVVAAAAGGRAMLSQPRRGARFFAVTIAAVAASSVLVVNATAQSWEQAWKQEQQVLSAIGDELPALPRRTTLILDGVCPYTGAGIVFESSWDLAGALQTMYDDESLRADVTAEATVEERGIAAEIYGDRSFYPFGPRLIVFDYDRRSATPLPDAAAARRHFGRLGEVEDDCPEGAPGEGTVRLPFDNAYKRLEARRFRPWS